MKHPNFIGFSSRQQQAHFISQSTDSRPSIMLMEQPYYLETLESAKPDLYAKGNKNCWSPDTISDFLDYPIDTGLEVNQVDCRNNFLANVDITEKNWQELAEQFIRHESLTCSATELISVANVADTEPKVPELPMKQSYVPASSLESVITTCSAASNAAIKKRMRWTSELHEAFVDGVNKLGGSERATPKGVLKLMKVDGLTIYQVKSHLQKYRTSRYVSEPSEGSSQRKHTTMEDLSYLDLKSGTEFTEALRLQMEVQKRLHEQLEIQRNLQLRIEEQGRYLQIMFEKQSKSVIDILKSSSSISGNPLTAPIQDSLGEKTKGDSINEAGCPNVIETFNLPSSKHARIG